MIQHNVLSRTRSLHEAHRETGSGAQFRRLERAAGSCIMANE
jgi:hypothetical protein